MEAEFDKLVEQLENVDAKIEEIRSDLSELRVAIFNTKDNVRRNKYKELLQKKRLKLDDLQDERNFIRTQGLKVAKKITKLEAEEPKPRKQRKTKRVKKQRKPRKQRKTKRVKKVKKAKKPKKVSQRSEVRARREKPKDVSRPLAKKSTLPIASVPTSTVRLEPGQFTTRTGDGRKGKEVFISDESAKEGLQIIMNYLNKPSKRRLEAIKKLVAKFPGKSPAIAYTLEGSNSPMYITLSTQGLASLEEELKNLDRDEANQIITSGSVREFQLKKVSSVQFGHLKVDIPSVEQDGHFFPYLNKGRYKLDKYQIFKEIPNGGIDHCLEHALKYYKIDTTPIIPYLRTYVKKGQLKQLAEILNITIELAHYGTNKRAKNGRVLQKTKYNAKRGLRVIYLGIYLNHYFVNDVVGHYDPKTDKLKRKSAAERELRNGKKDKAINMINAMYKAGKFVDCPDMFKHIQYQSVHESLVYLEDEQQPYLTMEQKKQAKLEEAKLAKKQVAKPKETIYSEYVYAGDLECYISNVDIESENIVKNQHGLFLSGFVNVDDEDGLEDVAVVHGTTYIATLSYLIEDARKREIRKRQEERKHQFEIKIYYHNLKYDWSVIASTLPFRYSMIKTGGSVYGITFTYQGCIFSFVDFYKMVAKPLSAMPTVFGLDGLSKKEYINYKLYQYNNIYVPHVPLDESGLTEEALNNREVKHFINVDENKYYHVNHITYYLRYDCMILKESIRALRKSMMEMHGLDVFKYLTISSLANGLACKEECYKGTFEICGGTREFISKCVRGGMVLSKDNDNHGKWRITENAKDHYLENLRQNGEDAKAKELENMSDEELYRRGYVFEMAIAYYDACSLYPTAMLLCGGFVTGKGERMLPSDITFPQGYYYCCKVLCKGIRKGVKPQQIPFISYKDEVTKRVVYTNDPTGKVLYVDRTTLEDYVNFCGLEFEFIEGIIWKSPRNKNICKLIRTLYDSRLRYKQLMKTDPENYVKWNTFQELEKLIMNSIYGKNAQKPSKTQTVIVGSKHIETYLSKNINRILTIQKVGYNFEIKLTNSVYKHYNKAHIACQVLSVSKRLMFEVLDIANENDIDVFYCDTDSMHIDNAKIQLLTEKYEEKYSEIKGKNYKGFEGSDMTNFHLDFNLGLDYKKLAEMRDAENEKYGTSLEISDIIKNNNIEVKAIKTIIVGRKAYFDHVVNGTGGFEMLKKLKGVGKKAWDEYKNDIAGVYERLFNGEAITFNQLYGGAPSFDCTNSGAFSRTRFERTVQFPKQSKESEKKSEEEDKNISSRMFMVKPGPIDLSLHEKESVKIYLEAFGEGYDHRYKLKPGEFRKCIHVPPEGARERMKAVPPIIIIPELSEENDVN